MPSFVRRLAGVVVLMQCSCAVELSLHPAWQIVSGAWYLTGRVAS